MTRIETSVREREASQELTNRFFADASHELRTPLASLRANAELYQQGALTERSQVDEAMRRIVLESQRMGALVDDLDGQLADLGQRVIGLFGHPEIQARTFAALILAALVRRDAKADVLAAPTVLGWRDRFAQWWLAETDLRGFDDRLGWLHAVEGRGDWGWRCRWMGSLRA